MIDYAVLVIPSAVAIWLAIRFGWWLGARLPVLLIAATLVSQHPWRAQHYHSLRQFERCLLQSSWRAMWCQQ